MCSKLDRIFIRGLALECQLGVHEHERANPQKVVVTLEISLTPSPKREELPDTLCYKLTTQRIQALPRDQRFKLVESLAERIAELVLTDHKVAGVKVEISKPDAICEAREVGVIVERSRNAINPHSPATP